MSEILSPLDRLDLFEQQREAIDREYLAGKIGGITRRERLAAARDCAGITEMRTNARRTTGMSIATAEASDDSNRRRRQQADKRRYAKQKATNGSLPMAEAEQAKPFPGERFGEAAHG